MKPSGARRAAATQPSKGRVLPCIAYSPGPRILASGFPLCREARGHCAASAALELDRLRVVPQVFSPRVPPHQCSSVPRSRRDDSRRARRRFLARRAPAAWYEEKHRMATQARRIASASRPRSGDGDLEEGTECLADTGNLAASTEYRLDRRRPRSPVECRDALAAASQRCLFDRRPMIGRGAHLRRTRGLCHRR